MSQYLFTPPIVTNGLVYYSDPGNSRSYIISASINQGASQSAALKDLSGTNDTLTLGNTTSYNSSYGGWIDYAADYATGISGSAIPALDNLTQATWNFWLRVRPNTPDYGVIIGKHDGNVNAGWFLELGTTAGTGWDGMGFQIVQTTNAKCAIPTGSYATGSFINVAMVWNGDIPNLTGSAIYVNAVKIPFSYQVVGSGTHNSDTGYPLILAHGYSNSPIGMNSGLSAVMIYNRQLSQAEILQNYNAHKSRYGLT